MTYRGNETFDSMGRILANASRQTHGASYNGINAFKEWQNFKAGRTNAQLASDLVAAGETDVTEAKVQEMRQSYNSLEDLFKFYQNDPTASAGPHEDRLRDFS